LKSGPAAASDGVPRPLEEGDEAHPRTEFLEMPSDTASCSAGQQNLSAIAEALVRAVAAGDDVAVELANALADAVLEGTGAKLALSVLDGGPLTITRAIRLAEQVLTLRCAAGKAGAS
jgi:hypothetical protein